MKRLLPLLAAALALCLLLQGCWFPRLRSSNPVYSGVPSRKETAETTDEIPARYYDYGYREYLGHKPVPVVPFGQMNYVRPDVDALLLDFDALIVKASDARDAGELLEGFYRVYDAYTDFFTMEALADLRYCLDQTDGFYSAEYEYCLSAEADVEQRLEALYKAFAASECRTALERNYFGRGFFDYYDDYEYYTNDAVLALSRQEAELLVRYRAALEAPTVELDGRQRSYSELSQLEDWDEYDRLQEAYYQKYNPILGELYVGLVRVRQQLAAALGYERYDEYAFAADYGRDYSPQEADVFLAGIRAELAPIYTALWERDVVSWLDDLPTDEASIRAVVKSAAQNMGDPIREAHRFMDAYELSDLTQAEEKTDMSFVTYLYSWEAPFLTVDATGFAEDITSFAHEFGHFTDAYYNYNAGEDLETSETYSQAMEYLALCYTDRLDSRQKEKLLQSKLEDTLNTFIEQAAYADFERRVYALEAEALSVEQINAIYRQIMDQYGITGELYESYYSLGWIDVPHFFEMPFYVVSYCVSADTSLQIYELEKEAEGQGLRAYLRLLDRDYDAGIQQLARDAGLEDPFEEGRLAKAAAFLRQELWPEE